MRRVLGGPSWLASSRSRAPAPHTIGFGAVAGARADGYTLGAGPTTPISVAPHLIADVKYGVDSFEYICTYRGEAAMLPDLVAGLFAPKGTPRKSSASASLT